ncbi:hypothetical protein HYH03_008538 [Edaphochlamys debaryana]|uniref:BTB domain-containing protein n=1 Tax=Edaphochlamys debaryana TaxID=47281 RepID=A0A835Y012_9CHLO|nr:hypothetical protein HYH03_008538 [Edaphochlamys debaryana]|eukprot:KAG2493413.1 hypothetical protein HYH03_008538 [Edaphochlamys debaryana]
MSKAVVIGKLDLGPRAILGVVVRPPVQTILIDRPESQTLAFLDNGAVHELQYKGGIALGPQVKRLHRSGWDPVYDPASKSVYYNTAHNAVAKLDSWMNSEWDVLAAPHRLLYKFAFSFADDEDEDGKEEFTGLRSLSPDGDGGVWGLSSDGRIRRLQVGAGSKASDKLATLEGARAPAGSWRCLAYDLPSGTLWAATDTAVCRVRTEGSGGGGRRSRVELVAGDREDRGDVDGSGTAARFKDIAALLPVPGGRLLIADGSDLRCMDAGGAVSTLLRGCLPHLWKLVLLPDGDLMVVTGRRKFLLISYLDRPAATKQPSKQPSKQLSKRPSKQPTQPSQNPAVPSSPLLSLLLEGAGGSGGSCAPVLTASGAEGVTIRVTVRVGEREFSVPRSVLVAGSEYFAARLLVRAKGKGSAKTHVGEVTLPDADPAAFAHLLSYMYRASQGLSRASALLRAVPPALLRPTAALAGRLQLDGAVAVLTERLAAAATPASVLSDLAWADANGFPALAEQLRRGFPMAAELEQRAAAATPATVLSDLVWAHDQGFPGLAERLRAYAVAHRGDLEPSALRRLVEACPAQAAELLAALAKA